MNLRFMKFLISLVVLGLLFTACQSDYTKLVKSELAKGIRKDSILLGINFGTTRQEFYGKCFDLNKQKIVSEGANYSVQYLFTDSAFHDRPEQIRLLFVPAFDENEKISNIDFKFDYPGWAPGITRYQSDSLKGKIMKLMMKWYGGNEFITAKVSGEEVPVKLDGNRRILVFEEAPKDVVVRVQDILNPKYRHSITPPDEPKTKE